MIQFPLAGYINPVLLCLQIQLKRIYSTSAHTLVNSPFLGKVFPSRSFPCSGLDPRCYKIHGQKRFCPQAKLQSVPVVVNRTGLVSRTNKNGPAGAGQEV